MVSADSKVMCEVQESQVRGPRCCSVVEHFPSMHEALGVITSTVRRRKGKNIKQGGKEIRKGHRKEGRRKERNASRDVPTYCKNEIPKVKHC